MLTTLPWRIWMSRNLIIVLGDQLNQEVVVPPDFDACRDMLWMAESAVEARRVWSHKARLVFFISAMRHFRDQLRAEGLPLIYAQSRDKSLEDLLDEQLANHRPQRVMLTRPGDWHVLQALQNVVSRHNLVLEIREDAHFLCSLAEFTSWAEGRKQWRMEHFYRHMRRQTHTLINEAGEPCGGQWNFDQQNRRAFGRNGPGFIPQPVAVPPDELTQDVICYVNQEFSDHPGSLDAFDWPVNREQSLAALHDFIEHRLPVFGDFQDAMWTGQTWLFHSRLSAAMNLHLLAPHEVIRAAVKAYEEGHAPLASVEGFVRQILGWREFVRGLYWLKMPDWQEQNYFGHSRPLPDWYWSGETEMECLRDALDSTLRTGYAHHIQRLMVTGLFSLLLGVAPSEVEAWFHAIYVDAVSWVELPNTLGMSQFADGGALASKPYLASGAYIQRMSNACEHCRFNPKQRIGDNACPFTVLYWNFLDEQRLRLQSVPRFAMQLKNLDRISAEELHRISRQAESIRESIYSSADPTLA